MTSTSDGYESLFGARLRSYADRGVAGMPSADVKGLALTNRNAMSPRTSRVWTTGAVAVAVALGVLVAVVGLSLLRPPSPVGVKPTASPLSTASPTATPIESTLPTAGPTLPGETSGPTASAPPGVHYIPALTIDAVFAVANNAGFSCQSVLGNVPDNDTLYQLVCTKDDQDAGYNYVLTAAYWTADRLNELHLEAHPLGATVDPVQANSLFNTVVGLPFSGSALQTALAWLAGKTDGPGCAPCLQTFGQVTVEVESSSVAGAGSITVTGMTISP